MEIYNLDAQLTMETAKKYISNFEKLSLYFSPEAIEYAFTTKAGVLRNFAVREAVHEGTGKMYEQQGYPKLRSHVLCPVHETMYARGKIWESHEDAWCDEYLVRCQYHHTYGALFKEILLFDYPWLSKYRLDCYEFSYQGNTDEFYVKIIPDVNISLYVPYEALVKKDPEIIRKRVTEYWSWYYSDKEEKKKEQLDALDWPETKEFFAKVAGQNV